MQDKKIAKETYLELVKRARKMRADPTEAEAKLWDAIRRRQLDGLRFRRQHVIGAYIVDFFSYEVNLIIEVDGEIHKSQREYDQARDDDLRAMGYLVLRFSNELVRSNLDQVLEKIKEMAFR